MKLRLSKVILFAPNHLAKDDRKGLWVQSYLTSYVYVLFLPIYILSEAKLLLSIEAVTL